jgi:hypothetical protein
MSMEVADFNPVQGFIFLIRKIHHSVKIIPYITGRSDRWYYDFLRLYDLGHTFVKLSHELNCISEKETLIREITF